MILIYIILGIALGTGVSIVYYRGVTKKNHKNNFDKMVAHKNELIVLCEEEISELKETSAQMKIELENAVSSLSRVREELHQERLARKSDQVEIERLRLQNLEIKSVHDLEEQQISSARGEYEALQLQLEELSEHLEFRKTEIANGEKYYSQLIKSIEEMYDQKTDMIGSISDLQAQLEELGLAKVNLFEAVENLKRVNNLAVKNRLKDEEEDECGWAFELTPHEAKLVALIDELKIMAPQLSSDLSGIVWKRI